MANHTITLDAVSAKLLIRELKHLEEIKKTILRIIPESLLSKGSELWWEKNNLEALEDFEKGKYATIKTHKQLDQFLDKLE